MNDSIPTETAAESEAQLAERIRAERIRFVFVQSSLPIVFSPLAALILSITLWPVVEAHRLLVFAGGLLLIAAQRVLVVRAFPDPVPAGPALRHWEKLYVGSIMLVDLWWGLGALFLIVPGDLTENAIVFSFVMMMAGGHTASYSAHPWTVVMGVLALAMPITIAFALQADAFHLAFAFVALMFFAATFRSVRTLGYFFERSHRLAHALQRERDRAEQLARCDALTGISNRRAFYERGQALIENTTHAGTALALVMIDIDHFKAINDRYGHAGGDAVIRAVAQGIESGRRKADFAGRLGGEEFGLLLPATPIAQALEIARALVEQAGASPTPYANDRIPITVSAGAAQYRSGESFDALLARADAALYVAKSSGRNRAVAEAA